MEIGERRDGNILVLRAVGAHRQRHEPRLSGPPAPGDRRGHDARRLHRRRIHLERRARRADDGGEAAKAATSASPSPALNSVVQEIFAISRFARVVPVYGTATEGVAALKSEGRGAACSSASGELAARCRRHSGGRRARKNPRRAARRARAHVRCGPTASTPSSTASCRSPPRRPMAAIRAASRSPASDEYVLCDLGSGVREFGLKALRDKGPQTKSRFNMFLSHVHWDHIMGFPFFPAAYIPGNVLRVHGCHKVMREALQRQQSDPCFPVDFRQARRDHRVRRARARADLRHRRPEGAADPAKSPGNSYGYRFELTARRSSIRPIASTSSRCSTRSIRSSPSIAAPMS